MLDYDFVKTIGVLLGILGTIIGALGGLFRPHVKAWFKALQAERMDAQDARINGLENRVSHVEADIAGVKVIAGLIVKMDGKLDRLHEDNGDVRERLSRIEGMLEVTPPARKHRRKASEEV